MWGKSTVYLRNMFPNLQFWYEILPILAVIANLPFNSAKFQFLEADDDNGSAFTLKPGCIPPHPICMPLSLLLHYFPVNSVLLVYLL